MSSVPREINARRSNNDTSGLLLPLGAKGGICGGPYGDGGGMCEGGRGGNNAERRDESSDGGLLFRDGGEG